MELGVGIEWGGDVGRMRMGAGMRIEMGMRIGMEVGMEEGGGEKGRWDEDASLSSHPAGAG